MKDWISGARLAPRRIEVSRSTLLSRDLLCLIALVSLGLVHSGLSQRRRSGSDSHRTTTFHVVPMANSISTDFAHFFDLSPAWCRRSNNVSAVPLLPSCYGIRLVTAITTLNHQ